MASKEASRDPGRIARIENRYGNPLRWGLLVVGIVVLWAWRGLDVRGLAALDAPVLILFAYALATLAVTLLFGLPELFSRWEIDPLSSSAQRVALLTSYIIDYAYVAALVAMTGGFHSDLYLLFGLLALRVPLYYVTVKAVALVSFLSGPLWVGAGYFGTGTLYFLATRSFLVRYGGLFLWTVGCAVVGWLMERRQRSINALEQELESKRQALREQTGVVRHTANEMANRLLELRSLQESVKAINSALTLDALLQLIVENATRVLRGARCTIALVDDARERVKTSAAAGVDGDALWGTSFRLGEGVAGWVVENCQPARIDAVDQDPRFVDLGDHSIKSLISVPLVSEDQVIGALTATSSEEGAFDENDVNLLDAFGDQAAIAVKNARLYEQLLQEEKETTRLYTNVLEKSNELEAILRAIGDAVIVADPNLRLLMMNPVAARIFDVRQVPEEGVRLPEIIPNEDLLDLTRETLTAFDGSEIIREIELPEPEGANGQQRGRIYQALASTVRGADGQVRGVVVVMRDITTQKEIEQVKSDLLSVVSHELRTPLHSIKGFVDIILMGKTGEVNDLQRDFLTTVKESTTNLQRLIDDLLEFSRMEAGQIKLEPEAISLHAVAETTVEQLSPLAQEGDLALENRIPQEMDLVEADPMRIEQVLTNLVSNAIKFTPPGGTILLRAEDLGDSAQVAVEDTGIGIPEKEIEHVFDRFYQVDGSATRSYRGTGLGLTICKFIVEYHHGRIWVESEEGEGTRFYFVLPKKLPEDEALVIDFTTPARRD